MRLLMVFLLILTSCGRIPQPFYNGENITYDQDPYFDPFIVKFKEDAKNNNTSYGDFDKITVIKFEKSDGEELAPFAISKCAYISENNNFFNNFYKEMYFKNSFKQYTFDYQYKIFLHEMGHCAYHLNHNLSDINNIMYPSLIYWKSKLEKETYTKVFFEDAKNNQSHWLDSNDLSD